MKSQEAIETMGPSIYEHQGMTFVAFGSGSIQMGVATDDIGQVTVYLMDVRRENPIGMNKANWEQAIGRTVVLGFNKIESLHVLAQTIQEAIDKLTPKPTSSKDEP